MRGRGHGAARWLVAVALVSSAIVVAACGGSAPAGTGGASNGVASSGGGDGGSGGGQVIATGTPEQVARSKDSYTATFLAEILG